MKIRKLRTNHIKNPVGFAMEKQVFSYVVEEATGAFQKAARIRVALDEKMTDVVYDSGWDEAIDSIAWQLPISTAAATRYYWTVEAEADNGEVAESEVAYFETAPDMENLTAVFIEAEKELDVVEFFTTISVKEQPVTARAYATALGIYELRIDGEKVGEEFLSPYSNDYDSWLQVLTHDVTAQLTPGEHEISMVVTPGWYSGYFGFEGKKEIYGKEKAAFLQLELALANGTKEIIVTDENWKARECAIRSAEIYHGEVWDATFVSEEAFDVTVLDVHKNKLQPRRSLPVRIMETVQPVELIHTPAGETVLDLGQNMAGWLSFYCRAPKGTKLFLQYGEILQNGNFYRENLREAKAEFTYISDGEARLVRPHATYYGFRYVKLEGFGEDVDLADFVGEVIYSQMDVTGSIVTGNPLVNRLTLNALWGQKGNFVDVPSDCPQRDERLGWTGDAQVFSGTALFQMDAYPFYVKFGHDMLMEQKRYDGCVPMVIPSFHMGPGGSSAWADAATVIPWNTYVYTGDAAILAQQYSSMKLWADWIYKQDVADGDKGLWQTGFHFGDWLALDGTDPFPTGKTDPCYIASAYYYLSTRLTAQAAEVLGYKEEAALYEARAEKIKTAMAAEYFTEDGDLILKVRTLTPTPAGSLAFVPVGEETAVTQTGYVLALTFGFCPEEYLPKMAKCLNDKIKEDGGLVTGFVGTPVLCPALSANGYAQTAYDLLLNEEMPGWLYCVKMGATTIWERWNSVLPDGTMNPEGMNSLNHYAYGSIAEWMYRYVGGIQPIPEKPGFREVTLTPMPDARLKSAEVTFDSPVGTYVSAWSYEGDTVHYHFEIPFGAKAYVTLPGAQQEAQILSAGSYDF